MVSFLPSSAVITNPSNSAPGSPVLGQLWLDTSATPDELKVYDGPLEIAHDLMVINVTKDHIETRMAIVDEYVLLPDVTEAYIKAPRIAPQNYPSKETMAGKWEGYTPPPMPERPKQ